MIIKIDLNSDLGEHPNTNLDEQIMPYISSCNIACGGHIGDAKSVKETIELANKYGVAIGAHPSFPDRKNFGREILKMDQEELRVSLRDQILLVKNLAEKQGIALHHVKPHGALYNHTAKDVDTSTLICDLIIEIDPELRLYGLAHSTMQRIAEEKKVNFIAEAFADRRYEIDKTLRSRSKNQSVLTEREGVLDQVQGLVFRNRVKSDDWISIKAQTICLHSDTKGAVILAKAIRTHLEEQGVGIHAV